MIPVGRRAAAGFTGVAAALILAAAPSATADPAPNCTAADLAGVAASATASTATYLFTHPDVNAFFTGLEGSSRETILARQKEYFAANPQVKAEMTAIRQPLIDAKLRCGSTPESLGVEAG